MKDKWMNINHEDEELKPYIEPESDFGNTKTMDMIMSMGYTKDEIEESLKSRKYDDIMANYLLLGKRTTEVSIGLSNLIYLLLHDINFL